MKTIIHIGSPKTGTTALQRGLFDARKILLNHGVLYPELTEAKSAKNHGPISLALVQTERLPRKFRFLSESDRETIRVESLREIIEQVNSTKPACLLLSSEYLFRVIPFGRWQAFLEQVPGFNIENVRISCYIRRPSAHYLSILQQKLKASHEVLRPSPHNFRRVLKSYAKQFPNSQDSVRLFDRRSLLGEDILFDFAATQLHEYLDASVLGDSPSDENATVSAESMFALREFRKRFFPNDNDKFRAQSSELLRELVELEQPLGLPKPKLKTEIADQVDYSSKDVLWLRDSFDLAFNGYRYERAGAVPKFVDQGKTIDLGEIVEIDDESLLGLLGELQKSKFIEEDQSYADWLRSLIEKVGAV